MRRRERKLSLPTQKNLTGCKILRRRLKIFIFYEFQKTNRFSIFFLSNFDKFMFQAQEIRV